MKFFLRTAIALVYLAPVTRVLASAENVDATSIATRTTVVDGNYLLELVFALGLVVVCILLFAWLLKRLQGVSGRSGSAMRVVGALSLGTRERVVLVQVGDRQVLVGVAPGRVSRVCEFDSPVVDASDDLTRPANFASLLDTIGKRGYGKRGQK